jgi:hypothetical protein
VVYGAAHTEATSRIFEKYLNVMEVTATAEHKELRMLQRYTHPVAEGLARKTRLVSARVFPAALSFN